MIKKEQQSVGRLIGMINRQAHIYFKQRFKHIPLGHAQIFTLHYLIKNNGITQKKLTQYFKLDKGSVASQLHYLEANGFIKKEPSKKDARIQKIFISDKTREIKKELRKIFRQWSESILTGFNKTDRQYIIEILEKLAVNSEKINKELRGGKK